MTRDELTELLTSKESFRIERTVSTTDKDKFGETVCAFANDMPDSGKPGYLLVGVRDDGSLSGLKATDELSHIDAEKPHIGIDKLHIGLEEPHIDAEKPLIGLEKPSVGSQKLSVGDIPMMFKLTWLTEQNVKYAYAA